VVNRLRVYSGIFSETLIVPSRVLSDCYFLSIILKTQEEWKDIRDIKPLLLAHYLIQECFAQTPDSKATKKRLTLPYQSVFLAIFDH
jgi:hypothetical protein